MSGPHGAIPPPRPGEGTGPRGWSTAPDTSVTWPHPASQGGSFSLDSAWDGHWSRSVFRERLRAALREVVVCVACVCARAPRVDPRVGVVLQASSHTTTRLVLLLRFIVIFGPRCQQERPSSFAGSKSIPSPGAETEETAEATTGGAPTVLWWACGRYASGTWSAWRQHRGVCVWMPPREDRLEDG
jgi:hypothetical protein